MRIAFVSAAEEAPLFAPEPASHRVRECIRAMTRLGHEVSVFAAAVGRNDDPLFADIHLLPKPAGADPEEARLRRNATLPRVLARFHRRRPFHVVWESYALWSYSSLRFATTYGLPTVFDLAARSPIPSPARAGIAATLAESVFRSASLLAAASPELAAAAVQASKRTGPVALMPNGVDLDLFRDHPPSPGRGFTIGFLGELRDGCGIGPLYEAFQSLYAGMPDTRLVLAGNGPLRPHIEERLRQDGLGAAVELGPAPSGSRIPALLHRMDVVVAPQLTDPVPGCPAELYQAMAAGRAILAPTGGPAAQLLADRHSAMLVKPGDAAALTLALGYLRSRPAFRTSLGDAARREAFLRHGWTHRVNTVLDTLSALRRSARGHPLAC